MEHDASFRATGPSKLTLFIVAWDIPFPALDSAPDSAATRDRSWNKRVITNQSTPKSYSKVSPSHFT